MSDKWNFLHHSHLTSGGRRMKFIIKQLIEISAQRIINWFVGIFHITFGQLVYWSEQAKGTNLKESD